MLCLICSEPIKHAHIGVNSCRACAVFYRRTANAKRELKCKSGAGNCLEANVKSTCRKCRYERFTYVLARAESVPAPLDEPSSFSSEDDALRESTEQARSFTINRVMDHNSFHVCEPSTSQTPQLDRIRKGYSLMCLIRKTAELATKGPCAKELEILRGDLVLTPGQYSTHLTHLRIAKGAMRDFGNYAFPEFRALDEESKGCVIDMAFSTLNAVDCSYRATRNFPDQEDMRISGYTTYVRSDEMHRFFDNCPDDIDSEGVVKTIRLGLEQSVRQNRRYFKRAQLSDFEVCALLGLALWNDEISSYNDAMTEISACVRQRVIYELKTHYERIGVAQCAERIGHIFTLRLCFQDHSMRMREDIQLFRLMNLFKSQLDLECEKT